MAVWMNLEALLRHVEQSLQENLKETPAQFLSAAQVHILAALYQEDGQHASVLARNIGRAATSFTPLLDRLENAGIIERQPDPSDRRAVFIYLCPMGKALKPHIERALSKLEAQYPEYSWKVGADELARIAKVG